jgi:nucleoside-diphosphate-sugar epimerase
MKVVITGGAGLIGRRAAADLAAHGHELVCVDRVSPPSQLCRSLAVDLMDVRAVERVFQGAHAVVHLARVKFPYTASGYDAAARVWRKPDTLGDAERFSANVTMTYNVLAAAFAAGVERLVLGSSFAVYGFYYPSRPMVPDYVPIDEAHPRRPDDPYGLSKLAGEELADGFARRSSMQIASLRFPGVAGDDPAAFLSLQSLAMRGPGGLGTYVDARDAAAACRAALEAQFEGHQPFNICAPTTLLDLPTRELLRAQFPQVTEIRTDAAGNWAGYDTSKAEKMLGFKACHTLR